MYIYLHIYISTYAYAYLYIMYVLTHLFLRGSDTWIPTSTGGTSIRS